MIYLDNAATTMHKPDCVPKAVAEALTSLGNASRGAHDGALSSNRIIYRTRTALAEFFGCPKSEQLIFCSNSTEALNIAISGTIGDLSGGGITGDRRGSGTREDHCGSRTKEDHCGNGNRPRRVITTCLEHNSVLRPLYRLRDTLGTELDFVGADLEGRVDYADFERLIRPETCAIVCTHASNLTGNVLDIARIGKIAKQHKLLFIVDASQTAGSLPIHMQKMDIDILCFTGHKSMMGPQGTGGLCINGDIDVKPFKVGGTGVQSFLTTQPEEYPTRLEAGTLNGHGIAGLSAALRFIMETGAEVIHAHEAGLALRFYGSVRKIKSVKIYGDFEAQKRCPIVTINIGDLDSAFVADELSYHYGIAVRAGAHCAPLMHRALGTENQGAVRFSFGYFNTLEECDAAAEAVAEIAERNS